MQLSCYNIFMEHEGLKNKDEKLELPTTSADRVCRFYLSDILRRGRMEDVKNRIDKALRTQPETYGSTEDFLSANPNYEENVDETLDYKERLAVRSYSGYRFAWINSVARGFWDYEKMGRKTPELEEEIKSTTRDIISAISKAPAPEKDFMTFRGTNLDGFQTYGIKDIKDLARMKGQFILEQGFTSTAIVREKSFAERQVQDLWIGKSNVEMRYHIPAGADNIIALTSEDLSYSPEQTEVLIDHDSLSYISDVNFDREGHAIVDAILIPRSIYE